MTNIAPQTAPEAVSRVHTDLFVDGEWERFRCRSGPPAPAFTPTVSHLEDHWSADPEAIAIIDGVGEKADI